MSLSPVWTCTFKYEWKWARTPLNPGVDAQTACSFRFKYCSFFFPLLYNSYHMGWASASQLLIYKHSFDCKLNGKGCQLSLSSRGHTTRAPAVKNWHSCSERHHMLLLWAEQDLTLALLTLLLSQRGDGRDKSLTSQCEFTQRHVPALSLPILLPLKEVKIYLGRWLSVLSFREESLTWARVYHIDFEVCYEIINALSLKAPHCDQFSSLTGLPGLQPECQNKTTLDSPLSRDGLEQGTLEPSTVVYTHKCVQGEFGQEETAGVCNSELSSPLQETAAGPGQVPVLGHVSWHEMWQLSWEQAESKAAAAAGKGLPALGFQEGQGKSICCVL